MEATRHVVWLIVMSRCHPQVLVPFGLRYVMSHVPLSFGLAVLNGCHPWLSLSCPRFVFPAHSRSHSFSFFTSTNTCSSGILTSAGLPLGFYNLSRDRWIAVVDSVVVLR